MQTLGPQLRPTELESAVSQDAPVSHFHFSLRSTSLYQSMLLMLWFWALGTHWNHPVLGATLPLSSEVLIELGYIPSIRTLTKINKQQQNNLE